MTQQPDDLVEQKPAWWMPRYIKTQAATITALRQRVAELEGERDSYKAALEEIRQFGREHTGYGYSCAFAAHTALERRGSE